MSQAPVYFAVIQVRFNSVLALDSYLPKIQDRLRHQGFPDTQRGVLATFNLNVGAPGEAGPPQVPVSQIARYTFGNMEKTAGFVLDQGALALQTTDYDRFESFSETFLTGLGILHEAVGLAYTDRVGVRYLDAVYPKNEESISAYLRGAVLGLSEGLAGDLMHSFSETRVRSGTVNVIARTIIQTGSIGFPPDLQSTAGLVLAERFRTLSGLHAILDTDGAHEGREAFSLDGIKGRLSEAHSAVIGAFRATVTQNAIDIWE
ncbi:MAG: TIGR04255 family protein [Stellaceae bacterium]